MIESVMEHLGNALKIYSNGKHFDTMLEAKNLYFSLTGQVFEEDEDYESRMSAFNDWYLLQFVSEDGCPIWNYVSENTVEDNISKALRTIKHSIYEYQGRNLRKQHVLKDIVHNRKITLSKRAIIPSLIKNDLFIGRVIETEGEFFTLSGLCLLPGEIKNILKKEGKKVRLLNDSKKEVEFLLRVESLKTKWNRYGHLDAKSIFVFN
ncbi:hypothetical protein [Halobacteriovorax sp. JY17]|uniref:hypothetical protein n=1 Tax=Halobacteriovorax sp. JY17 TaxID=2014617 RepID=UPI000C67D686|nr:hypothetical protein [Halobacteriovorax sp. JY17]PIK13880.1 MAG: hypothetical protein CES88_12910 [Halobacteriovorax sp. JY17]